MSVITNSVITALSCMRAQLGSAAIWIASAGGASPSSMIMPVIVPAVAGSTVIMAAGAASIASSEPESPPPQAANAPQARRIESKRGVRGARYNIFRGTSVPSAVVKGGPTLAGPAGSGRG